MKNLICFFCLVFCCSSFSVIAQTPEIFYNDGLAWQTKTIGNVSVSVAHSTLKDYGKWHQLHISICNLTDQPIEFISEEVVSADYFVEDEWYPLEVFSADRYQKKVKRSQNWGAAFAGAAVGFSAGMSGSSTYSGTAYSPATGPVYVTGQINNAGVAATNTMIATQQLANMEKAMNVERKMKVVGYIKRNTIFPGDCVSGYILAKYRKGEVVQFNVLIGENNFTYQWEIGRKGESQPLIMGE